MHWIFVAAYHLKFVCDVGRQGNAATNALISVIMRLNYLSPSLSLRIYPSFFRPHQN